MSKREPVGNRRNVDALYATLSEFWGPELSAWDVAQFSRTTQPFTLARVVFVPSDGVEYVLYPARTPEER